MATNFRLEIGRNRRHAFLHGTRIPQRIGGCVNSAQILPTSYKNLVNFGPLTPEFTVMIWRPFMRQMGEIGQPRSILGTRIRQWIAGSAERICAKFTRTTCLVLRSDELEYQGQKPKVKVIRDKNALCTHNTPAVWTKWKRPRCR